MKFTIDKLEDVAEPLRAMYKQGADGKFHLDVDMSQHPEVVAIRKNKEEILGELKTAEQKLKDQEAKLRDDKVKGHITAQEFDQAMALKQTQFDEQVAKLTAGTETLKNQLKKTMLDGVAVKMAAELAGDNAHLLDPIIRGRLEIVEKDGELKLFVKDASGINTAMTTDQLQKELNDDKKYASVIKGRDSSGGNSNANGGVPHGESEFEQYFKPGATLNLSKQAELEKSNPAEFKRLNEQYSPLKDLNLPKSMTG